MQAQAIVSLGRIVVASLQGFEVECFQRDTVPSLGSLVTSVDGECAVYGAVSAIVTEGVDPSRPVAPHGTPDEDLKTVLSRNPHLPILLRTTFTAIVLGHESAGGVRHYLPENPPSLFARVRVCTPEEQRRFVQRLDFLEPLLQSGGMADEVGAAVIRRASQASPDPYSFLLEAGRTLVPMLAGQSDRLAAILRRIRP